MQGVYPAASAFLHLALLFSRHEPFCFDSDEKSALARRWTTTFMSDKTTYDQWDRAHAWHPFTQMEEYLAGPPLQVDRGSGCWLWDIEGNRYLDTNASVWTNVHGHNDPDLNAVVVAQLEKVAHSTYLGLSHPRGAELGQRLVAMAPDNLQRAFFTDNGSNAIEVAMKMSLQYFQLTGQPQRTKVIGMEGGYHGDTVGTMAAGKSGRFHDRFKPWFLEAYHFPAPECCEYGGEIFAQNAATSLAALEKLLAEHGATTCCLVIEPSVQGAAGMQQQPPGFLQAVAKLCRKYGVHLILDEVFVGFGRLGSLLVCKELGVQPDFLCLSKGLTAGYLPLAATLIDGSIYAAFLGPFEANKAFFHGHTFTGNPLAAAVALKSIEKLVQYIDSGQLAHTIDIFGQGIRALASHRHVASVRQRGLAAAIDLYPGDGRPPWPVSRRAGWHISLEARAYGLLVRPIGNTLMLVPPIVIQPAELDFLFAQLTQLLNASEVIANSG